jgi:hypothetical protein
MDLFEYLESVTNHLCPHAVRVGKDGTAWTRNADPTSKYYGTFVHSDPNCRRPAHMKEALNV